MPNTKSLRLYPLEQLATVYEYFAKKAVELFNTEGSVTPQFFMVGLGTSAAAPIISLSAVDPRMVQSLLSSSKGKDMVKPLLRMLLNDDSPFRTMMKKKNLALPDVVVQINEAWMTTPERSPGWKEFEGSLENLPGRQEAIVVAVHGPLQSAMGICPIDDTPVRRARYQEMESGAVLMTGRMSMNEEYPDENAPKH